MLPVILHCIGKAEGVPFANEVFLRRLMVELGSPKVVQIFAYGNACVYGEMCTDEGSNCVIPRKDVPFDCEKKI